MLSCTSLLQYRHPHHSGTYFKADTPSLDLPVFISTIFTLDMAHSV